MKEELWNLKNAVQLALFRILMTTKYGRSYFVDSENSMSFTYTNVEPLPVSKLDKLEQLKRDLIEKDSLDGVELECGSEGGKVKLTLSKRT